MLVLIGGGTVFTIEKDAMISAFFLPVKRLLIVITVLHKSLVSPSHTDIYTGAYFSVHSYIFLIRKTLRAAIL